MDGRRPFLTMIIGCCCCLPVAGFAMRAEPQPFDVPQLTGIQVDGDAADWQGRGLQVHALKPIGVDAIPVSTHDARFTLGWDADGLLVLAWVRDDTWLESAEKPWTLDGIELFLAPASGHADVGQWIVLPGMTSETGSVSAVFFDHRKSDESRGGAVEAAIAQRRNEDGSCVIEVRLPWSSLNLQPELGDEVGFQIWFNDADKPGVNDPVHVAWFEGLRTFRLTNHMHRLRLVRRAGSPELLYPTGRLDMSRNACRFYLTGAADLAEQPVTVLDGDRVLAAGTLEADAFGRASGYVFVPLPPFGISYDLLTVRVGDRYATRVGISEYDRKRREQFAAQPFIFDAYVFDGEVFPGGRFRDPAGVEAIIGDYTVRVSYYDAAFEPVATAERDGRYGAVVSVTSKGGATVYRYATLFRKSSIADGGDDAATAVQLAARAYEGRKLSPAALDDLWWSELKARTGAVDSIYKYIVFLPQGYEEDPERIWPLFVYLHGGGMAGGTFERFKREGLPPYFVERELPYVVVVPHSYGYWNAAYLRDVVDQVRHTYNVDAERFYLLGHSLGGKGVAAFIPPYGHRVAAAVMMGCGGGDVEAFASVPTWVINGENEADRHLHSARKFIEALKSRGGEGRFVSVPGLGHGVEVHAMAMKSLHKWLQRQSRTLPYTSDAPEEAPY